MSQSVRLSLSRSRLPARDRGGARRLVLALATRALAQGTPKARPTPAAVEQTREVVYGEVDDTPLLLDVMQLAAEREGAASRGCPLPWRRADFRQSVGRLRAVREISPGGLCHLQRRLSPLQ